MLSKSDILVTLVLIYGSEECGEFRSGMFPWNVGIYLETPNQLELVCLGTVIQTDVILTAAHCFYDDVTENIRDGSFYIATANLEKYTNTKTIEKIPKNSVHIHKHYKGISNSFENDLAIIKSDFDFNEEIMPVCVDWSTDINDVGTSGIQPVWSENKIIKVEQNYHDCRDGSEFFQIFITKEKLCTQLASVVSLNHQSEGAGLVFLHSDRWYLKGVVSVHDVKGGQLSTYTNVQQYMNWISNIVA